MVYGGTMTFSSYDLCGPNPNPMTKNEVDSLKYLVKTLDEEHPVIINIGAERGVSTLAMLEERPDAYIFSIDIGECPGEKANIIKAGLDAGSVTRVLGDSSTVGNNWPYRVNMVFVDGDHSEQGVRKDIVAWRPRITFGGILAFHDYIPDPIPLGIKGRVAYAVDDLIGYDITGKHNKRILWTERLLAFQCY